MAALAADLGKLIQYRKKEFWKLVQMGPDDACWPWLGSKYEKTKRHLPYGKAKAFGYGSTAHRVAYLLYYGELPAGKDVCHKCDNPPCCNPDHLFLGDDFTNMQDCKAKGRNRIPDAKGEDCAAAKLTEVQVKDIRKLKAEGWTHAQIAEQFGICFQNSSLITLRKNWKHVP